ncbi:MFS transporter [Sphingomonas sp.]|uniref:MFS transporter n=1 Tax=Sphingomonas sp. TaxID=28214 RepID=UPI00261EEB0F|nr:MFS transporter [Sphingomonas sp.]MDF2495416.1 drug resistance transporter, Bcr/CflA subfamily [Sphingomonas sp.]
MTGKTAGSDAAAASHDTRWRLIILGGIAALGSLAVQIIIPALPMIAHSIGATSRDAQLIIAVYAVGLALGQLICGPLADRHGRRPVMMIGLVTFLVGSLCCAAAPNLLLLLCGRAMQSLGASATLSAARVMATDRAPIGGAAGPLAILTSVALISPALAPVIGGAMVEFAGWRALFLILAAVIALALVLAAHLLPETRPWAGESAIPLEGLMLTYRQVLRDGHYVRLALSSALITAGFQLFLAVSPFLFVGIGLTPAEAGFCYSGIACAIIAGTLAVPLLSRWRGAAARRLGAAILAAGGLAIIAVAAVDTPLAGLLVAMTLLAFGAGLTGPTFMAEAIEGQRARLSTAVGLYGALQSGVAALIATVIVRLSPLHVSMGGAGVLVLIALILRHRPSNVRE